MPQRNREIIEAGRGDAAKSLVAARMPGVTIGRGMHNQPAAYT